MSCPILQAIGFLALVYAGISDCRHRDPVQLLSAPGVISLPVAEDRSGLDSLAALDPGRASSFRVVNPVRVKVLQRDFGGVLVEVLDGDQAGRRGWMFQEWVSPK